MSPNYSILFSRISLIVASSVAKSSKNQNDKARDKWGSKQLASKELDFSLRRYFKLDDN